MFVAGSLPLNILTDYWHLIRKKIFKTIFTSHHLHTHSDGTTDCQSGEVVDEEAGALLADADGTAD